MSDLLARGGIDAAGLTRTFTTGHRRRRAVRTALSDVSFTVPPGEVVGLLGPNGAGKTTAVRILAGLLAPTSGKARVCSFDATNEPRRVHRVVGVSFGGDSGLYTRLGGLDNLRYFATMYGLSGSVAERRCRELLERVGLGERGDDRVETYSRGMRQRLHVARALINDPRVLMLDEPSSGLDPEHARQLRGLVTSLRSEGRAILLTTHDMLEAEQVCGRVVILRDGRLVRGTGVRELREDAAWRVGNRLEVRSSSARTAELLTRVPGLVRREDQGGKDDTYVAYTRDAAAATRFLLQELGDEVLGLSVTAPSLEDAYLATLDRAST